jgi:hypothetical protein
MWGAARARGGALLPGTREHDTEGSSGALGGWRVSFGGFGARGSAWVRRRGRTRGGVRMLGDRLRFFLSDGGGAEAAGVSVVERGGRSATLVCCSNSPQISTFLLFFIFFSVFFGKIIFISY